MAQLPTSIVVATDFSPSAERAVELALHLAGAFGARVHLLHVKVLLEDPHLAGAARERLEQLAGSSEERTQDALSSAGRRSEVEVTSHVVRGFSAAEAILEAADELRCDLLVLGTHGRRGLRHLLVGSVAEAVVRRAALPVVTVREDAVVTQVPDRILAPHDFSERSLAGPRLARGWAQALGAEVELLHVVEPTILPEPYGVTVLPMDLMGQAQERSRHALEEVGQELLADVPWHATVRMGRAAAAIGQQASESGCGLVVMATHGLTGFEHVLLGSVAEQVVRTSPVPVLTVHARA